MTTLGPYALNSIITGDARELAGAIPDNSVDLIFTDPPYLKEFLPLYEWLAETAERILKPGGWLFAYGATEHLPNHLERMGQYLDYFWVFTLLHNGGYPRMWH
jgi:predicted methyltransferase